MDPERLKAWTPVAFLLILASIISATVTFTDAYSALASWIKLRSQSNEETDSKGESELIYPVLSGYINGNGNTKGDIYDLIADHKDRILFLSAAIDLSTGVGENDRYVQMCDPYYQETRMEKVFLRVRTSGTAAWLGPDSEDFDILCGENILEINLRSELSKVTSAGVDILNFSGVFRVYVNYEGLSERVVLDELAVPLEDEGLLRERASQLWSEIYDSSKERY